METKRNLGKRNKNLIDKKRQSLNTAFVERIQIVRLLVSKGANINAKSKDGSTPLFVAISTKNFEIAQFLVSNGADVDAKNKDGFTPLLAAVVLENLKTVKTLVTQGADVDAKDKDGTTPLHAAVFYDMRIEIAKFLVAKGANVNAKDKNGKTPLDIAKEKGNAEMVEYLSSTRRETCHKGGKLAKKTARMSAS